MRAALLLCVTLAAAGCPRSAHPPADAGCVPGSRAKPAQVVFGGARPVTLSVPKAYDACVPAPLVVVLHGYGAGGTVEASYLGLDALVDGRGVLLAAPDGTRDQSGAAFWNPGTPSCCDFYGSGVDDVAYLSGLLHDIRAVYAVDASRIVIVGHSNGGFMAHRLGCLLSNDVTAVVSLAGTMEISPAPCPLARPVSVLQVHGDRDPTVLHDGGTGILGKSGPYASAPATVAWWAAQNGCQPTPAPGGPLDLDTSLDGAETGTLTFSGCAGDAGVALWTIRGGSHIPTIGTRFPSLVWRWLEAHRRP